MYLPLVDAKREGRKMRRIVEPELTGPLAGVRGPLSPKNPSEEAEIPPWPKYYANGKRSVHIVEILLERILRAKNSPSRFKSWLQQPTI